MTESAPAGGAAERAGARAAANTTLRAAAEIAGKLVSLLLFAGIAREYGQPGLGAFVLAFAIGQIAIVPVDFGLDRRLTRQVAEAHEQPGRLLIEVLALKSALLIPIFALLAGVLPLLGYSDDTRLTALTLFPGLAFDSLARSAFAAAMGIERGGVIAIGAMTQRVTGAGLGILVLSLGYGIPVVGASYSAGAALGFGVALVLLARHVAFRGAGAPRPRVWGGLLRSSVPFAFQDIFTVLLFRLDAVLLSFLATEAAVGLYGAAYRVLEATLFISYSFAGAFAAMYTYLDRDSVPSIGAAFGRSLKAALAVLLPCAVAMGMFASPLLTTIFGDEFAASAPVLRLLAPASVLVGLVVLSASLVAGRGNPSVTARLTGVMLILNVALNLALIPAYEERGAAAALLVTEALLLAAVLRVAASLAGPLDWRATLTGPLLAGAAMASVPALAGSPWVLVLAIAGAVYVAALVTIERITCPEDVAFVRRMLARRWPGAAAS